MLFSANAHYYPLLLLFQLGKSRAQRSTFSKAFKHWIPLGIMSSVSPKELCVWIPLWLWPRAQQAVQASSRTECLDKCFFFFFFFFPTSASIFAVQAFKIMADEYIHCGASQQSFSRITKVALNVYICCISDSLLNYVKLSNWEPEDCLFVFFFPLSINNVLQKNHTCSYLKNIVKQLNNILSKNIWQSMI